MIAENKEKDIRKISEEAFRHVDNPKTSIEKLCKLKAVGPATASGNNITLLVGGDGGI